MNNILDLKDKRIIAELDKNSRQTNVKIGKLVGLSKQITGIRIKKLVEEKIITKFHSVIDISKLGFTVHKNFLRFQNLDDKKEKALIKYLLDNPDVVWLAGCDGKFDLAFGVWASNIEYLDHILREFNKKFGEYIAERQISTILAGEYFERSYILNEKRIHEAKNHPAFGSIPKQIKLDEIDWKILKELGEDARKSAVEISKVTKTTAETVSDRIKSLEKETIIKGYNIVPNEEKYPYFHYKVLIGLKNFSEEKEKRFIQYCHSNSEIIYIVRSLGQWEFEIDLEIENTKNMREIMMKIKNNFSDIIKEYTILSIYKVYKYNFCPSIKL